MGLLLPAGQTKYGDVDEKVWLTSRASSDLGRLFKSISVLE